MWFVEVLEIADAEGKGTGEFRLTARSDEGGGGPHASVDHRHGSRAEACACSECRAYIERVTGMPLVLTASRSAKSLFKAGQRWRTRGGGFATVTYVLPDLTSHAFPIVAMHADGTQRTHGLDGKNTFDGNDSDLVSLFEGGKEVEDFFELRNLKREAALLETKAARMAALGDKEAAITSLLGAIDLTLATIRMIREPARHE